MKPSRLDTPARSIATKLKPHDAFYELLAWVLLMSAASLMMNALQQVLSVVPASPILATIISIVLFLVAMKIRRRRKR